jgi:hypothetical protein
MIPTFSPEPAAPGWTLERRVRFLRHPAETGNVRAACAEVGLSRQSVYKLRRHDRQFAFMWNSALEVARDVRIRRYVAALEARREGVSPCGIGR